MNSSSCSLYVIVRPSVVCLSVTLVHPTQAIEIFGNISTPCGTLAIHDLCIKILRRSSQGNPSIGELNTRRVAEYSDFGPIERYLGNGARGAKLVLITNRKSHMGFRLVPNSVTLDDLERRNIDIRSLILPNSVTFGADYVKVVVDTLVLTAAEM